MSHRIALVVIAAAIALANAPTAAADNHLSDPARVPWGVVVNSFSN